MTVFDDICFGGSRLFRLVKPLLPQQQSFPVMTQRLAADQPLLAFSKSWASLSKGCLDEGKLGEANWALDFAVK